jgi:type I restriction enzyme, S subunit
VTIETLRLSDVATFVRGITFRPDDVVDVNAPDSVACMRTKNIQATLDTSDVWGVPRRMVKRENQYLSAGDLLISSANSWNLVGKCCWVPELPIRSTFGGFISVLRADRRKVDPRYLFWWFSCGRTQAIVRSFGQQTTNISNLNFERCSSLHIPLPSLVEQRRIAAILDKADALRAKRRTALAQLDRLTRSVFLEMFGDPGSNPRGWSKRSLGSLAIKFSDGPFGSNLKTSHYAESGVRVIRLQNIGVGEFLDRDRAFVPESYFASLKKHECAPGDVLIATMGDPNLRACIQPASLPVALNKADCVQLRVNPRLAHATYVCTLLNQSSTERSARALMHGQTRVRISMGQLRNLEVLAPPLDLQLEFSRRAALIEELGASIRHSLNEIVHLFASLQHRAFHDEL